MPGSLRHLFGAMRPDRTHEVEALMATAFDRHRDPRSLAYKMGCRALLNFKLGGEKPACPFKLGTDAADAWLSGLGEGHGIWDRRPNQPNGDKT